MGARWACWWMRSATSSLSRIRRCSPTPDVACDTVRALVKGLLPLEDRMVSLIALDQVLPRAKAEAA